jgi:hypothetical protein
MIRDAYERGRKVSEVHFWLCACPIVTAEATTGAAKDSSWMERETLTHSMCLRYSGKCGKGRRGALYTPMKTVLGCACKA